MIFVTGDLHGNADNDMKKLTSVKWAYGTTLTKQDYLICCGDFGLAYWDDEEEIYWRQWLNNKPWTTLFCDGNHENFDRLKSLPTRDMFGGYVGQVSDSIFHLRRGEVYTIDGGVHGLQKFFVFGGASSYDKAWRVNDMAEYERKHKHPPVIKKWYPQEIPSGEEIENGYENLSRHDWDVDVVISHTGPHSDIPDFIPSFYDNEERMSRIFDPVAFMLQDFKDKLTFRAWVFGHFHQTKSIGKLHCLYNNVVSLEDILAASPQQYQSAFGEIL